MKLEVKNINKSFGEKHVLRGINFTAESGQALGLLGRNGAGKTTTIRILMDVFKADSGEVILDGKPIDHNQISKGYLPEERGLYGKKKIIDQLVYLAELKGMKKTEAREAVILWLKRLGMSEYKDARLDTLSKGNQQKIQIITAVVHNPDIVILDEPFSGLDPVNAKILEDVVKRQIDEGKVVIFSSHQMNYIEEFCNNIAVLNQGEIVLSGDIREIKRSYTRDKLVVNAEDITPIKNEYGDAATELEDGSLMIKMNNADDKKEYMENIISKYNVDEVRVYEPTLNDIFVEYTGKEEVEKDETV
ncbi:MAG: ATP-binding cassette domain-containing protein [Eubacterium sp.]|nr:ATP-binding cassette domain-containing protein [Eubacterium sp.]